MVDVLRYTIHWLPCGSLQDGVGRIQSGNEFSLYQKISEVLYLFLYNIQFVLILHVHDIVLWFFVLAWGFAF